jgi:hypothetical protein
VKYNVRILRTAGYTLLGEKKKKEREKNAINSGHYDPLQCQRAVHALRTDQTQNPGLRKVDPMLSPPHFLKPHAKFQNPTITPYGRKLTQ